MSEKSVLGVENDMQLSVFGHRRLRKIADIQLQHHVSNVKIRERVFEHSDNKSSDVTVVSEKD